MLNCCLVRWAVSVAAFFVLVFMQGRFVVGPCWWSVFGGHGRFGPPTCDIAMVQASWAPMADANASGTGF